MSLLQKHVGNWLKGRLTLSECVRLSERSRKTRRWDYRCTAANEMPLPKAATQCLRHYRKTYPQRDWIRPEYALHLACWPDLVIAADVIEHVQQPDTLLWMIDVIYPKTLVISTPARELLKLGTDDGPPRNLCHVREWSQPEFAAYIGDRFEVVKHFIVDGATQVIEAKRK
jgi:hypothetical protein